MTEGTDRPAGERRRRREAERAAARAAEQTGGDRPLTRRELRWQQAEEAARLEAIATGELPLGQHHERPVPPPMTTSEWAPSAGSAPSTSAAATPQPASAPSAPSASASGTTAVSAPSPVSAPSAASAASSGARPGSEQPRIPSRRSLRERAPQPDTAERPQERTATGRRPVVRTPSTAQGIRALDATGQLTGIQPVVRPDAPGSQPTAAAADAEPATGPAVWSERATFSLNLDGPARAARAALPEPDTAESAEETEDDVLLRPRWVAIDAVSGASPDAAAGPAPSRRSLRAGDPAPEPDAQPAPATRAPQEHNPAVTIIKVAVLVLVAAIIGALIWLLATDAFAGSTDALTTTIATTTQPEESSAS
ncbi:hypothetical protein M3148_11645 [Georgenia satyanarayanai]|uniref:hypothetical protein n=1 Tax=Georgenia satyanarayanai TaxID=860221 RepID=UPI00203EFAA5|nr:hypothetical protein [Georgenia satyanarayanai]MCM3661637.1 hypothetical protein [Georgenia satyanarayanai]